MQKFVHLNVHTEFSIVDGIVRIKPMIKSVRDMGMGAVAVSDQSNMFGAIRFNKAALAEGVKPIFGSDLLVSRSPGVEPPSRAIFLVQNKKGFKNLAEMVSQSFIAGQHDGLAIVDFEEVKRRNEGLIVLSGAELGEPGLLVKCGRIDDARKIMQEWSEIFTDRYYVEIQRTGRVDDNQYLVPAVGLADELGLPIVATNDVRFINKDEFQAHEVRVCINEGAKITDNNRELRFSDQQYLKSPEEMIELFSDIPDAIENTVHIAERCSLDVEMGTDYLPDYEVPGGLSAGEYLEIISRKGLDERLEHILDQSDPEYKSKLQVYKDRLQTELDVINGMGFPGYFLIVADFIQWSKDNDIPVGPGRGSGAGSLVAYSTKITDLDPLAYDLLFERFLNPDRVSMPDFDIDFCMANRDRVIDYVARKYGRDKVSQIITYGTMAAKAVIRDVGRVLGFPYPFVDRISKKIPNEVGISLERALEISPELDEAYRADEEVAQIIDLARPLEGVVRNAGKHAGGVVISPTTLTDFTPLYSEESGSGLVTQFDKNDVESVGLVKFDFLGLRTLTVIDWALKAVNKQRRGSGVAPIDINKINLDDEATFRLFNNAETTAVFQLESQGMKELIKKLQPDNFEDIIALVALYRPGPLQSGMVEDFINRKHGLAAIDYPHPSLEKILEPTYGVIVYQEQVMQIAQTLAGYTLGGADLLRRAMGKKKPEEMAKQRKTFVNGAVGLGVKKDVATYIFDLMEKFAAYGFNKSHSAAYALVSYQTAWLKAHYPSEFMAAVMSSDMDHTDKVVMFIDETRRMGICLSSPSVNLSENKFEVNANNEIVYGFGAIKGVGAAAIDNIVEERANGGPYLDLFDFCIRVNTRKVNKRVFDALINSGAMDCFGQDRAVLFATLPYALQVAEQSSALAATGTQDLFGDIIQVGGSSRVYRPAKPFTDQERLSKEYMVLGLYLSGHPYRDYRDEMEYFTGTKIGDLVSHGVDDEHVGETNTKGKEKPVKVAGLVVASKVKNTRRGKMAFLTLDDQSGRVDVSVFSDIFRENEGILSRGNVVIIEGSLKIDEFTGGYRMVAKRVYGIDNARDAHSSHIEIKVKNNALQAEGIEQLSSVLKPYCGGPARVRIKFQNDKGRAAMELGSGWRVIVRDKLLDSIREMFGKQSVSVFYKEANNARKSGLNTVSQDDTPGLPVNDQPDSEMPHGDMMEAREKRKRRFSDLMNEAASLSV